MRMDKASGERFASEWERAWNSKDIEGLVSHFAEDVLWTSPVAAQMVTGSGGIIRGRDALRSYYGLGMRAGAELHFEVLGVFCGIYTLVINYRNQRGTPVNEVLIFDEDGRVKEGHGTYPSRVSSDEGLPGTGSAE